MVCVTITRDPRWVGYDTTIAIRDAFHRAVVDVINVKPEDVEVRVRQVEPIDLNSGRLAVEVDSGPGKEGWRIDECPEILLKLNRAVAGVVPKELCQKGKSNMWLRVYAKGASMPIGCPELIH